MGETGQKTWTPEELYSCLYLNGIISEPEELYARALINRYYPLDVTYMPSACIVILAVALNSEIVIVGGKT